MAGEEQILKKLEELQNEIKSLKLELEAMKREQQYLHNPPMPVIFYDRRRDSSAENPFPNQVPLCGPITPGRLSGGDRNG